MNDLNISWNNDKNYINLYHGTVYNFNKIDSKYFREDSDFGKGFYLTSNFDQAKSWSIMKSKYNKKQRFIYKYEIPIKIIEQASIINFENSNIKNLNWLRIINHFRGLNLLEFRDENIDIEKSLKNIEIIKGPVYDNGAKSILISYWNNEINIYELNMKLQMNRSNQWCFKEKFIKEINLDKYMVGDILNG